MKWVILGVLGLGLVGGGIVYATSRDTCCDGGPAMATCTGSASCKACKNCSSCKHCAKEGGTCGVCAKPKK